MTTQGNISEKLMAAAKTQFQFLKSIGNDYAKVVAGGIPFAIGGTALPVTDEALKNPAYHAALARMVAGGSGVTNGFGADHDADIRSWSEDENALLLLLTDSLGTKAGLVGLRLDSREKPVLTLALQSVFSPEYEMLLSEGLNGIIRWGATVLFIDVFEAGAPGTEDLLVAAGVAELQRPIESIQDKILTAGPSISALETTYANDAARYGWNNQWSKYLTELEEFFCDYIGVRHALATSCCTGAMHMALLALGIGPGDEVIVPDIT